MESWVCLGGYLSEESLTDVELDRERKQERNSLAFYIQGIEKGGRQLRWIFLQEVCVEMVMMMHHMLGRMSEQEVRKFVSRCW